MIDAPSGVVSVPSRTRRAPPRLSRRGLAALLLVALATCTDHPTDPVGGGRGYLAIRPVFAAPVDVTAFGLTIDSLRATVIRPVADTVADTTVFFDPNLESLQLALPVVLLAASENLVVRLELRAGGRVLFAGTDTVLVTAGAPDTTSSDSVTLLYVGPGNNITTIRIAPRDSVVTLGGTQRFGVTADAAGVPVDSFYISWSTSDTALAPITNAGVLLAPNARGSVLVRAVTPNGRRDSTPVTFIPAPAALSPIVGGGQSQTVGTRLVQPLRVRVTASDLLGVKGIAVRFRALTGGGSVRDSVVLTDNLGFAEDSVTLGTLAGSQTFEASVTGLTPVVFTATAAAGPISAAGSVVSVASATVSSGASVMLTLQGKDAFGNNLTSGGATVVFTSSGGTSTGTIGATTDVGNGTYTATYTGAVAGTATTIGATINGTAVSTTLPQLSVTAGAISATTSVVSVASATVSSGTGVTLSLQAKDVAGNTLTIGGATVAFTATGGTSTGTIGATTDNGNGSYTATFTGAVAGTATTISATIGGIPVTTTLPTLTVIAGTISTATSVVSVASGTVASGTAVGLTLQAKDAAGNTLTTGGATVQFTASGGTSTGTIGTTTDNGDGTYSGTFTGALAGTATTIGATIGGSAVTSTLPILTVLAGTISAGTSVVGVSSATVASGAVVNLTLQARDAAGNSLTTGGATVVFSASGGTSTGTIGTTTDNGNGAYGATFTAVLAGTATTIGATIGGSAVTTPLPTITVGPGAISATTSVVTTTSGTVASGAVATLTLQAKDAAGNTLTAGGATVVFTASGGTSTGTIGTTTDNGNGTYSATFTGTTAGSPTTIGATIDGTAVTTLLPTITVVAGNSTTAQSIITVSAPTVASGGTVTLTLQARDSVGNNLTVGGLTVVFGNSGGTSSGTIGTTTDNGDGTYTATFTGVLAGTATTIGATINAAPVTSTLPTITVTPGPVSTATSLVSVSSPTVASGAQVTLTLQAKDAAGNNLTTGGAAVAFTASGGTSTGTIAPSPATDNGNGTYTATFTAAAAGTATTIGATIDGTAVTSTLPTLTVTSGIASTATSLVTVSSGTVTSGSTVTLTLQSKDAAGNNLTTGGESVVFTMSGGSSTGTIGTTTDNADGTYTATFTGLLAGTATTIGATINGSAVTSTLPTVTVTAGPISTATSAVTVADSTVLIGGTDTLFLQAKDAAGNNLTTGGATVAFTQSGGTSVGTIAPSPATDLGNGIYRAIFTATTSGTPTTIGATINTVAVTSAPLPTIRVIAAVHSVDITADSTWTAALSPHIVTGYLRVRNGATLTIEAGATVKFDPGAGLQVGDTVLNQAGGLILDGTGPGITLTANTASPTPGFWKGIEVQQNLGTLPWRNVRFEWGGSPRAPMTPAPEACLLVVNNLGTQPVVLDSVHFRQCVHAAIHHFGGVLEVRRSTIDSATGSGIHADFLAQLDVDSTVFRGSGNEGLQILSPQVELLASDGNQFLGNGAQAASLFANQLPGLGRQAASAGNGDNRILVHGGRADTKIAAFTIFRQPAPYLVVDSLVKVGRSGVGGATVTLDSGLVMQFGPASGLVIGDSGTVLAGNLVSLGTGRTNAPRLTSAQLSPAPGDWYGVEIGRLAANARLANVRIEYAGDSIPGRNPHRFGLWVRNAQPFSLDVDSVVLASNGKVGSDTNSAGFFASGTGTGIAVRRSVAESNVGYGFATDPSGVRLVDDTARFNVIGVGLFGASAPLDSVAGNVLSPGNLYPLAVGMRALDHLYGGNVVTGNLRDTLLLRGGELTTNALLPKFAGAPWRVRGPIVIDSGATLTVAAGDTVAFDDSTFILVGAQGEGAINAISTAAQPILFTASHPAGRWFGFQFADIMNIEASPTTFEHVVVEKAGRVIQCVLEQPRVLQSQLSECPISISGLLFTDPVDFATFTNVTVRHAIGVALDIQTPGPSTALVMTQSQFYANPLSPMIRTLHPLALQLRSSDIYQYQGRAIISGIGQPADSVDATDNWWGDVAGPHESSPSTDSLGRASFNGSPVRYQSLAASFATTPHFPAEIGPAVALAATTDTLVPSGDTVLSVLDFSSDPASADSLRVRALDALGRGVSGVGVTWQPGATPPAGTASPGGGASDVGGRTATQWTAATVADSLVMEAQSGLGNVRFHAVVLHGATNPTTVNWQVDPARTLGVTNATLDTVTYTSTNRTTVVATHARDFYGNVSHPQQNFYFFEEGPCALITCRHPAVDSIRRDTIFFRPPAVGTYVITGFYDESPISDTVALVVNPVPATVRIDRDNFTAGVQDTGTAIFNSICPVAGPCTPNAALREFHAFVVDSGATPLGNASARFLWIAGGLPEITFDSVRGAPAGDTAFVSAHANGVSWLVAVDTALASATSGKRDSMPILVDQVGDYIQFAAPDSASLLIGQSATFQATVYDAEGQPLPNDTVHFSPEPSVYGRGGITLTDTSVFNQVTLRMDSTPFGALFVEGFWFHPPKDTLYGFSPGQTVSGFASVMNPVQTPIDAGGSPFTAAVNTVTNRVYVTNPATTGITVISGADNSQVTVNIGGPTTAIGVNPKTNRFYVAQDTSTGIRLWAFDGLNQTPVSNLGLGVRAAAVAADTARNRVYVAANKCFFDPQQIAPFCNPILGLLMMALDGNTLAVIDTVSDSANGRGAAYNPVTDRIYVAVSSGGSFDTVKVIDAATFQMINSIEVGQGAFGVAVNPVTNRIYVTNETDGTVSVIDGATNSVIATVFMGFSTFPEGIGVDPVRNLVYVSHGGVSVMRIVDGVTNLEVGQIFVGGVSTDAQPNPVTGRFYVVVYGTGQVRAMRYE